MASESHKTVYVALAANAGIAVAKALGGAVSGSSAMLAEAAHSVADTTNQVFLLASLSLSERKPDVQHPFGYGKERFFWSFMAAIFIFVSGALFSIYEGVERIVAGKEESGGGAVIPFVVLAVALVLEGGSLIRATRQTRAEAERLRRPLGRHVRQSRDPTTKTVVFEDSAAVAGILLAAAGLALTHLTGSATFDGAASVAIGVLLAVVALALGRDTYGLLIGEAALPEEREAIERAICAHSGVDELLELMTMALGPDSILVAVRLDVAPELDSDAVEALASDLERAIRDAVPEVEHVFIDPTHRDERPVSASPPTR